MQSSAREALQVVAERFVAERWLENCDLKNFDGATKTLHEVIRAKFKLVCNVKNPVETQLNLRPGGSYNPPRAKKFV